MRQLRADVLSNEEIAPGFRRMRLASAYLAKTAQAGQFVEVKCSGGMDPLLRRPLGVHRIWPGGIEVLYEIVGKGTALLSGIRPGEELDFIGPLGNGFYSSPASDINILVAGGIGIAPLVALAEKLAHDRARNIHVFIGAKTKGHVLCEGEIKRSGCKIHVSTEDGRKGEKGLITEPLAKFIAAHKFKAYLPAFRRVMVYACGPTGMLKAVWMIAREHGIPCQVSLEERMACGVGVCLGCPVKIKSSGGYKMVCKDGPVFNAEELAW